jgi:hypothetical protein
MFVLLLPAAAIALVGYGVVKVIDKAGAVREHHAARTHR